MSKSEPCWSEHLSGAQLKIMQVQVGHECGSSTAIYTHVSDDYTNNALLRALSPALEHAGTTNGEDR